MDTVEKGKPEGCVHEYTRHLLTGAVGNRLTASGQGRATCSFPPFCLGMNGTSSPVSDYHKKERACTFSSILSSPVPRENHVCIRPDTPRYGGTKSHNTGVLNRWSHHSHFPSALISCRKHRGDIGLSSASRAPEKRLACLAGFTALMA